MNVCDDDTINPYNGTFEALIAVVENDIRIVFDWENSILFLWYTRHFWSHCYCSLCVQCVCDWAERSKKCACIGLQRRAYDPCWCWWHSTCRMQSNESCVYLSYLSQFLGYMVFKGCVPIKVDHPWNEKKMSLNLHWQ